MGWLHTSYYSTTRLGTHRRSLASLEQCPKSKNTNTTGLAKNSSAQGWNFSFLCISIVVSVSLPLSIPCLVSRRMDKGGREGPSEPPKGLYEVICKVFEQGNLWERESRNIYSPHKSNLFLGKYNVGSSDT